MDTLTLLEKLITFDTTSWNPNRDLIDLLAGLLRGAGAEITLIPDESGGKANLYATLGPTDIPGVALSGHTDVVSVAGQDWTKTPFGMTRSGGRLYGRGTCDMKGFVAAAVAAACRAPTLKTPLHLAFSYDEEIGCIGVRSLIDKLAAAPIKPRFCIVGEPTSMQVATGHKGKIAARVICHGVEGHSALAPFATNAIYMATDLIAVIRDIQKQAEASGHRDDDYDVPYTTLHVGTVNAGTALNIVPNRAEFLFEIRPVAEDDPLALLADIRTAADRIVTRTGAAKAAIEITPSANTYPGLATAPDAEVVSFIKTLVDGANETIKVAFGTEGGLFSGVADIPTVVCGPGAMAQAHKPDEFVHEDQLRRCDAMMDRLLERLALGI
ncbi:MAG: acetylornithine deacetylase [Rhodobacteraceae bacterium]|nr:acetylornithine deacetylase [Paracoccaceae bacterium]